MVTSDGVPVIHCVESDNLVHAHRWHLQDTRDLVHHAYAREAVLTLAQVEEGHHGSLLVLRRVPREDLFNKLLVRLVELERDRRVIYGRVPVLHKVRR